MGGICIGYGRASQNFRTGEKHDPIAWFGSLLEKDKNAKEGDICIKFSGLRPGEKLYEELLISDDAKETDHPRIKRALENKIDLLEITVILDNLQSACIKMDIEEIQHQLILAPADYSPAITA